MRYSRAKAAYSNHANHTPAGKSRLPRVAAIVTIASMDYEARRWTCAGKGEYDQGGQLM